MNGYSRRTFCCLFAVALTFALTSPALAAPTIRTVNLRGLQIGQPTTLVVDGEGLSAETKVLLPLTIVKQEVKKGGTDRRIEVTVTLDAKATPGLYHLRVANAGGVSNPIAIAVDAMPQQPLAPQIAKLPIALHGSVGGSAVVRTSFTGKAGQEIIVEVESNRLGGKLRPVVHLYDQRRVQLAWSWPTQLLAGDTRLTTKLPADGTYTVELHDRLYAAPQPGFYRLKIGHWNYADMVFPPAVQRGKSATLQLLGNLPPKTAVALTPTGLETATAVNFPAGLTTSGVRPWISLSDSPELIETDARKEPQTLPADPLAVSGRLSNAGEQDRYRLDVKPGAKLRFELFSQRLGAPTDGVIDIYDAQGKRLAGGDDGPGTSDPKLDYTVPANVNALLVGVRDLQRRGGETFIYRLVVTDTTAGVKNFRLTIDGDRCNVPLGGRALVRVLAERNGYEGPIQLKLDQLPAGVKVEGGQIPAGSSGTLLTLTAAGKAAAPLVTSLRGNGEKLQRTAQVEQLSIGRLQPWLAQEVAIATAPANKFAVAWGALPTDAKLWLGGKLATPIKLTRPDGEATPVRLALVTGQNVPKNATGQVDNNRAIRVEKAVELAAKANDGALSLVVPTNISAVSYDLAVRAELLSKDKKQVVAVAYTPVRRLVAASPLQIELPVAKAEIKPGGSVKLSGKIKRLSDLKSPVTLTVTGLSAGLTAAKVVVPADKVDFTIEIKAPATAKPIELKNVKLTSSSPPNPKQATLLVNGNVIPLAIQVVAAPAKKPEK